MAEQLIGAGLLVIGLNYAVRGIVRKVLQRYTMTHDAWARMVHQQIRNTEARVGITIWHTVTYDEFELDRLRPGAGTFFMPHITYEKMPCAAVPQLQDELAGRDTSPLVAILRDRARAHEEQLAADVARVQRMLAALPPLPSGVGLLGKSEVTA